MKRPSPSTPDPAQLPHAEGVDRNVSSIALSVPGRPAEGRQENLGTPSTTAATLALLTDAEVMLRVQAGDQAAFDYLVEKFRRPLVGFMYRLCHDGAVAEELAQEVFLRVYRSRASYAAQAKFTTWLYRIATNLAANHARDTRSERIGKVSLDEPDEETGRTIDVADPSLTAEQALLRRERMREIRKHVDALPERQRIAVVMHKYQGLDYRQIAGVLKLSESATKSLLFRAYETLRDKLKDLL